MFGFGALASRAFNSLIQTVTTPTPTPTWGSKGGIGKKKKEHFKLSARAELKEYLSNVFAEPVEPELKEEVAKYVKPSQGLSVNSIDYGKLAQNVELVQQIMGKINEIQQEHEDEALLLMLM
jgi:hypothetical protein